MQAWCALASICTSLALWLPLLVIWDVKYQVEVSFVPLCAGALMTGASFTTYLARDELSYLTRIMASVLTGLGSAVCTLGIAMFGAALATSGERYSLIVLERSLYGTDLAFGAVMLGFAVRWRIGITKSGQT